MKQIFAALRPRSLSTRLILLAAVVLFVAQTISFALLLAEHRAQWVSVTAAPAVLTIIDAIEAGDSPRTGLRRFVDRVRVLTAPPPREGRPAPRIEARATEMLAEAGISVRQVQADIMPWRGEVPHRDRLQRDDESEDDNRRNHERQRARVRLAVEVEPGRWLVTTARARQGSPPLAQRLIGQTLLIYLLALAPLLWLGRRLSRPLATLTGAVRDFSKGGTPAAVPEQGPDDIRDLTRAFNDMQKRLGAMLGEKDLMLGAIGHDLRTPLSSLRVRVESVEDEPERMQMIASIDDMRQMLDDILALARFGRSNQDRQAVDLVALVDAVVDDFAALGAPVTVDTCERAVVHIHPPAVRRAVRNLIDNAVKYGVTARVGISCTDGWATIAVMDDGPGIDPERLNEMLEPFTRLESSRNRETGGVGLGLALVRAVMRAEGGEIALSNRQDRHGLIAELRLPLR